MKRASRRRWLSVRRRVGFPPFSLSSIYPSVYSSYIFSLGLSLEGSLISPLEASIQRLAGLSTDITNFTFHPFSASNEATTTTTTTASRRGLALQSLSPAAYIIIPFFFFSSRERLRPDSVWRSRLTKRDRPLIAIALVVFADSRGNEKEVKKKHTRKRTQTGTSTGNNPASFEWVERYT